MIAQYIKDESLKKNVMKKRQLQICNKCLLFASPIVLASGIMLECLHGASFRGIGNAVFTWLHIISSTVLTGFVVWHLLLNWNGISQWLDRFKRHHSKRTKCTAVFFALTVVTGLIAAPLWLTHGHCGIGGVHGKFGYIAAVFISLHIVKHWKWYSHN